MTLRPGILRKREKGQPEGFVVTDITRKPRVAGRSSISMAAGAHRQYTRKRNCAVRSDEKPLRAELSSPGEFRAWMNRSYPEGNRLLL
jgi:hypothetical protein